MAQTLTERLTAAKSPCARLADNETLLEDLKAEQARLSAARDQAAGESIDFALSDDDRDEAAAKAARYDRTAKALDGEIAELRSLIEARLDSDASKAREAEKASALVECYALAEEFKILVKPAVAGMVDLFTRIEANTRRMAAIGERGPDAEAIARGLPAFIGLSTDPDRFLKMKLPSFEGKGRAWPALPPTPAYFDAGTALTQSRELRAAAEEQRKKAAAEYARTHGRYRIGMSSPAVEPVLLAPGLREKHGLPRSIHYDDWTGDLPNKIASQVRAEPRLKVTKIELQAQPTRRGVPIHGSGSF
jgi:hypothetical protein